MEYKINAWRLTGNFRTIVFKEMRTRSTLTHGDNVCTE